MFPSLEQHEASFLRRFWDAYIYCELYGKLEDKANILPPMFIPLWLGKSSWFSSLNKSVLHGGRKIWVFSLKSCGSRPTSHHNSSDNKKCMTDLFKVLWPPGTFRNEDPNAFKTCPLLWWKYGLPEWHQLMSIGWHYLWGFIRLFLVSVEHTQDSPGEVSIIY